MAAPSAEKLDEARDTLRRFGEKNAEVEAIDQQLVELGERKKKLAEEIKGMRPHVIAAWHLAGRPKE